MSIFRFKHFSIQQSNAALKVGTDSMLLGSLCNWENPKRLLDIGTGTGVLALMCAQRFNFEEITGLEISDEAILDAKANAENSPFHSPVSIHNCSLQDFGDDQLFDAIISNPPYFENSYKNEKEQLRMARHTDSLSFQELTSNISRLLSPEGLAWIIVPNSAETAIETLSSAQNLFVKEKIQLEGKPGKHVRTIFCLSKTETSATTRLFTIRNENGGYSEEYKELTKDFHDRQL
jgi:tRNA1Val (adenine37-N6)-methyltransferase